MRDAIVSVIRSPAQQTPATCGSCTGAVGAAQSAPSASTDGVSVEGWRDINITVDLANTAHTTEFLVYLYDGTDWRVEQVDAYQVVVGTDGVKVALPPFRNYGYQRLAVRIMLADGTTTFKVFPYNDE